MNTIQASELRIGNLVSIPNGQHSEILSIAEKSCYTKFGLHTYPFIGAIPLNEDWLKKFGFKKIGGELWDCNHVRGLFANNEFTPLAYLRPIKYVHDLMNLYFALTGTELTLTDK